MNVNNPDFSVLLQEVEKTEGFLPNTGQVVIEGSPETGRWSAMTGQPCRRIRAWVRSYSSISAT